jgi:transcriptional regulator with XRE-family HTH domain
MVAVRFGDNLRNIRLQRGMSQMELAKQTGTSQSAITSYENSKREPDFKTIQRFADFFNVPLSALLPSDDATTDDFVNMVAESIHQNTKLGLLFDKIRKFKESDLDAVLAVVNAISRDRENGD